MFVPSSFHKTRYYRVIEVAEQKTSPRREKCKITKYQQQ